MLEKSTAAEREEDGIDCTQKGPTTGLVSAGSVEGMWQTRSKEQGAELLLEQRAPWEQSVCG